MHSLVDKLKWFYETARCYNKICMSKIYARVFIRSRLFTTVEYLAAAKTKGRSPFCRQDSFWYYGPLIRSWRKRERLLPLGPLARKGSGSNQGIRGDRTSNIRLVHGTSDVHHILIYTMLHVITTIQFPVLCLYHITNSYIQFREEKYFAVINELGLKIFSRMVYCE